MVGRGRVIFLSASSPSHLSSTPVLFPLPLLLPSTSQACALDYRILFWCDHSSVLKIQLEPFPNFSTLSVTNPPPPSSGGYILTIPGMMRTCVKGAFVTARVMVRRAGMWLHLRLRRHWRKESWKVLETTRKV